MAESRQDKARKCPICGSPLSRNDAPNRPFCSDRCKMRDLGRWASGRYAIPGEKVTRGEREPDPDPDER